MFSRILVVNTLPGSWFSIAATTSLFSIRLLSYCVITTPPIVSPLFILAFTRVTASTKVPSPCSAKYSACSGIYTWLAAVKAFIVSLLSVGGQSIRM